MSNQQLEQEYAAFVPTTGKSGIDIADFLLSSPTKAEILHYAFALVLEAAELGDIVKKLSIYEKEFTQKTREHIVEELGDIEYYLEQLRRIFDISREETLRANITKLSIRYPQGYTNTAAQVRADKCQPETGDLFRE